MASDVPPDVHGLKEKLGSKVRYYSFSLWLDCFIRFCGCVTDMPEHDFILHCIQLYTHILIVYATHSFSCIM